MARTLSLSALAFVFPLAFTGCNQKPAANVAATVNNRPISYADLDREAQIQFDLPDNKPVDDQIAIQKMEVLRTLIDSEIMLQRAEKLNLIASDADVEAKLNELKSPYTQEEFQRQLQAKKLTLDNLKVKIRRDISIEKLFNKEIKSQINITDKDIADFYSANRANFNFPEPRIHMAQLVVTGQPGEVRNLKNDKAQNDEQARQKIQMLAARVQHGEDFGVVAQNLSEDPSTAPNGGDLGFVAETALEKANPDLRKMIVSMLPGQVSPPTKSGDVYRIFKVISKEPAGQRELNDPRVQESIREQLLNRKDQLLRNAYYETARNEAKVVNSYALNVISNKGRAAK